MEDKKTSKELSLLLSDRKTELADLLISKAHLEEKLAAMERRIKELEGGYRKTGVIGHLEDKLEKAIRYEEDIANGVKPVWETEPYYGEKDNLIISRITPKRIYLRKIGTTHEDIYIKETGKHQYDHSSDGVLNPTLTIKKWEKANK